MRMVEKSFLTAGNSDQVKLRTISSQAEKSEGSTASRKT
nr:MAG TPA: hypothetical protein [Caudoviricetes sp.]